MIITKWITIQGKKYGFPASAKVKVITENAKRKPGFTDKDFIVEFDKRAGLIVDGDKNPIKTGTFFNFVTKKPHVNPFGNSNTGNNR